VIDVATVPNGTKSECHLTTEWIEVAPRPHESFNYPTVGTACPRILPATMAAMIWIELHAPTLKNIISFTANEMKV